MSTIPWELTFSQIQKMLLAEVENRIPSQELEHFTLELTAENSQFIRFNHGRVRQSGSVVNAELTLTLVDDHRTVYGSFPFTGDLETDGDLMMAVLKDLRQDLPQLPVDPHLVIPEGAEISRSIFTGHLLSPDDILDGILPIVETTDLVGLYAGGSLIRAYTDSAGKFHWFSTESFTFDYSLFAVTGQAVKGTFAGSHWIQSDYESNLMTAMQQLQQINQPPIRIPKGQHRTYFAPAAVAEILGLFSWGGVSHASIQQGGSALASLYRGESHWSEQFNLKENFTPGLVPRFNELGETAPMELTLISAGRMVNSLICSRSAREYGVESNGAALGEYLRSPEVGTGKMAATDILKTLGTGLYVSNLHYLNWSDRPTARFTGMTRYACFWVEGGEIVAPIHNLRFDESLYRCFSPEQLISVTEFQEFIPEVSTYGHRQLGGVWVPGMVIDNFTYTL